MTYPLQVERVTKQYGDKTAVNRNPDSCETG